ncbi:death-associated protein 1 isoform X2 [Papio anubis]|uniref:death-associated protein 1 isoform X2 n=1 Tax=Papio anubis TaxID=9555 RepID=UPI00083F1F40|nr:death-associated protein 1 isoform X2 [Papio anubis]
MSSPPEGKLETKAGHPPAVKAGGMRIVQKHPHTGDTKEEKDKDDQEWESPSSESEVTFPRAHGKWQRQHSSAGGSFRIPYAPPQGFAYPLSSCFVLGTC